MPRMLENTDFKNRNTAPAKGGCNCKASTEVNPFMNKSQVEEITNKIEPLVERINVKADFKVGDLVYNTLYDHVKKFVLPKLFYCAEIVWNKNTVYGVDNNGKTFEVPLNSVRKATLFERVKYQLFKK